MADAIPVRRLPPEALGESKELEQPIPLTYLRQPPPAEHRLGPGDVLGIWIEGVLGEKNTAPPVRIPEQGNLRPAIGFPIPVRDNGSINLPLIDPIRVQGMSLDEAQAEIIKAYSVQRRILRPGRERVIVTLTQPRRYHVLVTREDAGSVSVGATGGFSALSGGTSITETRRSAGFAIELPAYENDLLNALTRTGGLPGYDAENEVTIQRGGSGSAGERGKTACAPESSPPGHEKARLKDATTQAGGEPETVRVPIRLRPGQQPSFRPEDIILKDGDIVSVRARKGDFFYTGGLLPPRAFPLPPGRDLNVVEAVALVGGPLVSGGIIGNNLTGTINARGLGNPSPSLIIILRRTPCYGQIAIRVNLNRALRDPRERILMQPGDIIILQETMLEAITRYISTQLQFNFVGTIIRERDLTGTATLNLP